MRLKILHLCTFKGTVRPDWICMRVVPLDRPCKNINRYLLLNFLFHFWIYEKTSKFCAALYKNESNLPLARITVCIESFLPIGCRTFIWLKNLPKRCTILVWITGCWNSSNILLTSRNPKNNCWLSRIFRARFGGKDRGLCLYKPWSEQAGGWTYFCMKELRTLKSFQIFQTKILNQKRVAVDDFFKAYPMILLSYRSNLAVR